MANAGSKGGPSILKDFLADWKALDVELGRLYMEAKSAAGGPIKDSATLERVGRTARSLEERLLGDKEALDAAFSGNWQSTAEGKQLTRLFPSLLETIQKILALLEKDHGKGSVTGQVEKIQKNAKLAKDTLKALTGPRESLIIHRDVQPQIGTNPVLAAVLLVTMALDVYRHGRKKKGAD